MGEDRVGAGDRWIPQDEYDLILSRVPILCVDLLLLGSQGNSKVGLILRDTYGGGQGWCLVGGAVLRNESLNDAILRHLRATLGEGLAVNQSSMQFVGLFEYFSEPRIGELYDPRKHAVSATFSAICEGSARVMGEAMDFQWFDVERLRQVSFGFGQGKVVERALS